MLKRLAALSLVAGHGAIHIAFPFIDLFVHLIAFALFAWSFKHHA